MKAKLSITLDAPCVRFLDSLPGNSRSAKIEDMLRRFRHVRDDLALRRALAQSREGDAEQREREAWSRTMEHDQWNP